jgi:LacI family transcriptional regulator
MTVSRVFSANKLNTVSEETQARVLAASEALGYSPNLLARGLVQNRTTTVGVVVLELANPFFAAIVSGIQVACAKRGFLTVVGESGRDEFAERRYIEQFRQFRTAGVIVSPVTRSLAHLIETRDGGTPVVVLERRWRKGDCVSADDNLGGQLVARHFLRRGFRRVGLVRQPDPDHSAVRSRVRGFRHTLAASGVRILPEWDLQASGSSIEQVAEVVDRLLQAGGGPSALFAVSDVMAIGIIHRLIERGVRVPEDIAVVGYDDIPFAACAQVPLTTVAIPKQSLGDTSVRLLFDRIDKSSPDAAQQISMSPELIIRSSSP